MASFITVIKIWSANAITQNTAESYDVNLEAFNTEGFFSLQIAVTGAGNLDIIWAASNDGTNFITPSGTADIFSAFGASSGPGSDGKDIASFDPVVCKHLRITATEQNAGAVAITAHLCFQ